jgi:hypothetical protein
MGRVRREGGQAEWRPRATPACVKGKIRGCAESETRKWKGVWACDTASLNPHAVCVDDLSAWLGSVAGAPWARYCIYVRPLIRPVSVDHPV